MISGVTVKSAIALGHLSALSLNDQQLNEWSNTSVTGFGVDSRLIKEGELFFALSGERVDGHEFLVSARERGAIAAVVEREMPDELPQISVANTATALAQFAGIVREHFSGTLVGITGSSGKTTIKNLVRDLLAEAGKVSATEGNLNNEIGVPLTIAAIDENADFAVVEMGAAQQGDIQYLAEIARPNIALVSNVGNAHVGRFGSIDITAKTKGEIYLGLGVNDTAVVNLDDDFSLLWLKSIDQLDSKPKVLSFSLHNPDAGIHLSNDYKQTPGKLACVANRKALGEPGESSFSFKQVLPGRHGMANSLAAIAVAVAAGLSDQQIQSGFDKASVESAGRLSLTRGFSGFDLIDDSYNANPESIRAAIEYLVARSKSGPRTSVLVLGAMAELGEKSSLLHREVGACAAQAGVAFLYCCGDYAEDYASGFERYAGHGQKVFVSENRSELITALRDAVTVDSVVLVKGSRSSAMEKVVAALESTDVEIESC